ncbi:hypothetical protein Bca101_020216 [Brassica carinata]
MLQWASESNLLWMKFREMKGGLGVYKDLLRSTAVPISLKLLGLIAFLPILSRLLSLLGGGGEIPEADSEAVPMAPLRQRRLHLLNSDGPRSKICEGELANIWRQYLIHPLVEMRSPSEFERAPDGGMNEVAVFEAYLEAGFRGGIPSFIVEVSSYFCFCPSQLTPLTWKTLMAIQVLGEFHGFYFGVHEILYSYFIAPLVNKEGFYHIRSRDGAPLVEELSRGIWGNYPFGDDWNKRHVFVNIQEPFSYPRSCAPLRRGSGETSDGNSLAVSVGGLPSEQGGPGSQPHEYQKAKKRKRRPLYTPPPRLAKAIMSVTGFSSNSPSNVKTTPGRDSLVDVHQRLLDEMFFLRGISSLLIPIWGNRPAAGRIGQGCYPKIRLGPSSFVSWPRSPFVVCFSIVVGDIDKDYSSLENLEASSIVLPSFP